MSKLSVNIISLTIVQLISYLAPIITLPYLSRILSIDAFGLTMLILSIVAISTILTDFGFNLYSPSWIANNRNSKEDISRHVSSIFIIKSLLFLITIILLSFYIYLGPISFVNKPALISIVSLAILSQTFQIIWFFQGIEKMINITLLTFLSKLFYVVLTILLVKNENDTLLVIFSYALSNIIAAIIGVIQYYKMGYTIKKTSIRTTSDILKKSFPFFLSRAAVTIYTSASTILIGNFSGLRQAALFSSAEKLYQAGQSISFPISQGLYPYLARTKNVSTFYRFMLILIPPLIIVISVIYYYSTEIIILFYGKDYQEASDILDILLITTVINFIAVNFGYPAFSILNRLDIANKSVIFAALLQLILLFVLYQQSEITAKNVALSILITESFVMLFRLVQFMRISKKVLREFK